MRPLIKISVCVLSLVAMSCNNHNTKLQVCGVSLGDDRIAADMRLNDYANTNTGLVMSKDDITAYINRNDTVIIQFEDERTNLIDVRTNLNYHTDDIRIIHDGKIGSITDSIDTIIDNQIRLFNNGKGWLRIEKLEK